ncbi:SRPBCC family protein [Arenimonas sp. MALMAid1274]|uniref:SRPBCC family protein n=1 Tax=Arenimonas sp. MALMAid1274 TaxID=3411630 RepID=UPI003BA2C56F
MNAPELVMQRTLQAPRALVWRCLSEAALFARWWGPGSHATATPRFEFRPGGICHYSMTAESGVMWGRFVYLDIDAPQRVVFLNVFSDASGGITRAPWEPNWPLEMHNTLSLADAGDTTTVELRVRPMGEDETEAAVFRADLASMHEGFGETFDQLATLLAALQTPAPAAP